MVPSYLHTKAEWEAVPMGFVHLRKDGQVIHKDPRAFLPRFKNVPVFDDETGKPELDAEGDQVYRRKEIPPACNLERDYLGKGWAKCKIDGSDLPGPKVEPKQTKSGAAKKPKEPK